MTMTANEAFEKAAKWCAEKRNECNVEAHKAKSQADSQPFFAAATAYAMAHDAIVAMKE